jgi:hypothetical protein
MRFAGNISKDGKFWIAEIPILDLMTQGRTRKEAFEMVADLFTTLADRPGFKVTVHAGKGSAFEVSSRDAKTMVSLLLQRRREVSGLSLAEASRRLGESSGTAWARYERGASVPTIEDLDRLLHAVSPSNDFVVHESGLKQ